MRIHRDYFATVKNFFSWILSRFKPFTVHTELIVDDDCWKEIKKKCDSRTVKTWYIMTPANFEYYKNSFNVKLSKNRISKLMRERYLWMKEKGEKLELHIHLSLTMKNMSYAEQEKLFNESIEWMRKEIGIVPTEFVPGWWSYNKDTLRLCKRFRLKMVNSFDYDYTHDYHWVL